MEAFELISDEIPSLKPDEAGLKAMGWMDEFKISELPVVDDMNYLGMISETDILDCDLIEGPVSNLKEKFLPQFVSQDEHAFEVVRIMAENELSILPVLDGHNKLIGVVTLSSLTRKMAEIQSLHSPGGIIKLELNIHDYSLSEISRLIESDDAKILNLYVSTHRDSTKMEVTIKINKTDLTRIIQTFERFEYNVTASFHQSHFEDDIKDRYESFMRYLDM